MENVQVMCVEQLRWRRCIRLVHYSIEQDRVQMLHFMPPILRVVRLVAEIRRVFRDTMLVEIFSSLRVHQ